MLLKFQYAAEESTVPKMTSNENSSSNQSESLSSNQLGKLMSELRVVEGNMTVLSEMLGELVPGNEPPSDLELLKVNFFINYNCWSKFIRWKRVSVCVYT